MVTIMGKSSSIQTKAFVSAIIILFIFCYFVSMKRKTWLGGDVNKGISLVAKKVSELHIDIPFTVNETKEEFEKQTIVA